MSSIAVTGWALDDTGIDNVKIYRKDGANSIYIGDATLVEGARPDVQLAYPGYPNNHKAGWGYMLLTNFLPNNGNGSFLLEAKATDTSGNTVSLGTKSIFCDNDNAVKPFGAIDTPAQGGIASGDSFVNWGWALTPIPNGIPTDGSTIEVFVDGIKLGNPEYNIYRSDIATLFPGYINSNGAVGYFYLNTTAFTNGVHTIQWTAKDNMNNIDGIGSRYFIVQNALSDSQNDSLDSNDLEISQINESLIHQNTSFCNHPMQIRTGFDNEKELKCIASHYDTIPVTHIKEMERIEIHLGEKTGRVNGYLKLDDRFLPLPIGSTMDKENGIFYWLPGPGFLGEYEFVFMDIERGKKIWRLKIVISPGNSHVNFDMLPVMSKN
jgi:hypothetical protein